MAIYASASSAGPANAGSSELVISNVVLTPAQPVVNYFADVTVTVSNTGDSGTGGFFVDVYPDRESPPEAFDIGEDSCDMAPLGPNSSAVCTAAVVYETPGSSNLWAQVDTDQEVPESNEANNVAGPIAVMVLDDSDDDSVGNPNDNCPNWPNPSQTLPSYGPTMGTGPDSDCDNFTNSRETYLGTEPTQHCAADTVPDSEPLPDDWPLDMNDNRLANTQDIGQFVFSLNSSANQTPPDTRWNQRHDFNGNGIVNTSDIGAYVFVLNESCSPAEP